MDSKQTNVGEAGRHTFVGVKGDLRIELRYADVNDGHGRQACLYIHAMRRPQDGVYIPFEQMWLYAKADRAPEVVRKLCAHIYGFVTKQDEYRLLDAIFDYMEDLKNHRPEPGLDKSVDDFLAECDEQGLEFFFEVGGVRVL